MKKTNKYYNNLEKQQAKKDGAKLVKNSGRGHHKGDARLEGYLLDYKFNAKSFQLTLENWSKLRRDAWNEDRREPIIVVKFEDDTMVAVVEWETFKTFYQRDMAMMSVEDDDELWKDLENG